MSAIDDDRPDAPGAMYDVARAALLGLTQGRSSGPAPRRRAVDALERLGGPADAAGEVAPLDERDGGSGQEGDHERGR
ncbi:hypothetical protein KZ813_01760 [Sphingomonas sp. RHCKR7]|uniref:hypothetical protein n=1 Tax=Sphingomonas folli TaxID=2862497 RepID=UPI001CA5D705|nr:hypothetical protein [Sphingomonas folli]MBW6525559.1 hypothetical protein [Sphingomonas folli]